MNILFITQDSISQLNPLIPIGHYYKEIGFNVHFAAGNRLKKEIVNNGFTYNKLLLEEENDIANNSTSILPANISKFLDKTRQGMIQTLSYQSIKRQNYFLWNPQFVIEQLDSIVKKINPKYIISIHLAYNATLALKALGLSFISFVTSHPMELPSKNEIQGYQYYYPEWADDKYLSTLKKICKKAQAKFTEEYNKVLLSYNSNAKSEINAYSSSSDTLIIFNYPENVFNKTRDFAPAQSLFIGSSVRTTKLNTELKEWLQNRDLSKPTLYVTLGTVLWYRHDIITRISKILRKTNYNVIFSIGGNCSKILEPKPSNWYVQNNLPQSAVLQNCDLLIFHGGNNSFSEALTMGVPMLVGPLSSDQFYCAADIDRMGLGISFDPNSIRVGDFIIKIKKALKCKSNCKKLQKSLSNGYEYLDFKSNIESTLKPLI